MTVSPARTLTARVLERVRDRDAYAPEVLDSLLHGADLSREDAALATRLAYGTLQTLGLLDSVIDDRTRTPSRIEASVRDVLRIATYEILFSRTPARAAVHQAVQAVKDLRPRATGMANAVLRRVTEDAPGFPWGDADSDLEALARLTAHPIWMVERLVTDLGYEAARPALEADNEPAPLYLRHNPFLMAYEDAFEVLRNDGARPAACELPGCVWAATPAAAVNGSAVAEGYFVVTDAAAQVVPLAASPPAGGSVVEIGAGRGTKTLGLQALAVEAGAPASILAVDVHGFKTTLLETRMGELAVPEVRPAVGDATDEEALAGLVPPGSADVVVVDAPCSGLGTLRRHPVQRWRIRPEDVGSLAQTQASLLAAASRLVREGGALVYSTCTLTRIENDEVVLGFLESDAGAPFETVTLSKTVPASWSHHLTREGWFRSLPSVGGPDGHFVARLERA